MWLSNPFSSKDNSSRALENKFTNFKDVDGLILQLKSLSPEALIGIFALGSASTLASSTIYRRYFRRIRDAAWVTPDILKRKQWVKGRVVRFDFRLTLLCETCSDYTVTHRVRMTESLVLVTQTTFACIIRQVLAGAGRSNSETCHQRGYREQVGWRSLVDIDKLNACLTSRDAD
jgi:hypothetical protein